jgi:hypothetical protein
MAKLSYLVIGVIVLPLAACGGQTLTLSQSPDHITLRWWNDQVAASEAANVATAYCAQMGRTMLLDGMEQHGSASVGRYHCI